jgi:hypothetical protein
MSYLKTRFLNLFESSDSIEVDGQFCRHYDETIHAVTGTPDEQVIQVDFNCDGDEIDIIITNEDLKNISICEEGGVWSVAGYEIEFYSVSRVDIDPSNN